MVNRLEQTALEISVLILNIHDFLAMTEPRSEEEPLPGAGTDTSITGFRS